MGLTTDDHRPVITQHPELHQKGKAGSGQSEEKRSNRQAGTLVAKGLLQSVHGKRREHFMDLDTFAAQSVHRANHDVFVVENSYQKILISGHFISYTVNTRVY